MMGWSSEAGVPKDALEITKIADWKVFYSGAKKQIYFYPASYHPGALGVTKEKLVELLRLLEEKGED